MSHISVFNWSYQVNSLSTRLSRVAGMLSKIRHYVSKATLRSIYFGIFSSLLTYGSQVWGQFSNINIRRLQQIQNKAIRIINFAPYREPVTPLYYKSNILNTKEVFIVLDIVFFSKGVQIHNRKYQHLRSYIP